MWRDKAITSYGCVRRPGLSTAAHLLEVLRPSEIAPERSLADPVHAGDLSGLEAPSDMRLRALVMSFGVIWPSARAAVKIRNRRFGSVVGPMASRAKSISFSLVWSTPKGALPDAPWLDVHRAKISQALLRPGGATAPASPRRSFCQRTINASGVWSACFQLAFARCAPQRRRGCFRTVVSTSSTTDSK